MIVESLAKQAFRGYAPCALRSHVIDARRKNTDWLRFAANIASKYFCLWYNKQKEIECHV